MTAIRGCGNQTRTCAIHIGCRWSLHFDTKNFYFAETTNKGSGGEIQLTDAIAKLLLEEPVYAYQFTGKRYDCGTR